MTGRLASLLLEQSATRDGHIADAVGRLTQVLTEVHTYRTWGKDVRAWIILPFRLARSSLHILMGPLPV